MPSRGHGFLTGIRDLAESEDRVERKAPCWLRQASSVVAIITIPVIEGSGRIAEAQAGNAAGLGVAGAEIEVAEREVVTFAENVLIGRNTPHKDSLIFSDSYACKLFIGYGAKKIENLRLCLCCRIKDSFKSSSSFTRIISALRWRITNINIVSYNQITGRGLPSVSYPDKSLWSVRDAVHSAKGFDKNVGTQFLSASLSNFIQGVSRNNYLMAGIHRSSNCCNGSYYSGDEGQRRQSYTKFVEPIAMGHAFKGNGWRSPLQSPQPCR